MLAPMPPIPVPLAMPPPSLAGVDPKNLMLAAGAGAGLAGLGLSSTDAIVSLIVFVIIASLTIAGPVVYYLLGGDKARAQLGEMRSWLALHNNAIMAVPFLILGRQPHCQGPATADLNGEHRLRQPRLGEGAVA